METTERWLPVVGYEGSYEVSDQGRVRSLDRVVRISASASGSAPRGTRPAHDRILRGKILGQHVRGKYKFVRIDDWTHFVAPMMLTAFVGPRPDGQVARHLNDDKLDNRLENLAWGTRGQNYEDAIQNGRFPDSWAGARNRAKTHCDRGHPLSGNNVRITKRGNGQKRQCLTCVRDRNQ